MGSRAVWLDGAGDEDAAAVDEEAEAVVGVGGGKG